MQAQRERNVGSVKKKGFYTKTNHLIMLHFYGRTAINDNQKIQFQNNIVKFIHYG